jgi:hypothetical protein
LTPYQLIGLPYRLGAVPDRHGAADCVSAARTVLAHYGIETPEPKREWYRRLRRGDTTIFREQLQAWGEVTDTPKVGVVALCEAETGFALATFFEQGWISFVGQAVQWSPIGALPVVACYCQRKSSYARPSA